MRPEYRGGTAQHERFREELTDEINAVIAGARAGGATQFIVNDGHGGTLFRNVLVDKLDPEAILIRGYPKPIVMSTGINPMVDAMMMVGAHANAGAPGVISHSFALDSFTVNGKVLNESGIAAFIGGEMGVPFVLTAGNDVLAAETKEMLGPIETVIVKTALSGSAAINHSPARSHQMLRAAAERAVRRTRAGQLKPLVFEKPYRVHLCLRRQYANDEWIRTTVGKFDGMVADGGPGCFTIVTPSAERIGTLLNEIEWTVLKPCARRRPAAVDTGILRDCDHAAAGESVAPPICGRRHRFSAGAAARRPEPIGDRGGPLPRPTWRRRSRQ